MQALMLEVIVDGPAQAGVYDVMRRIAGHRQIAAGDLVLGLGTGSVGGATTARGAICAGDAGGTIDAM